MVNIRCVVLGQQFKDAKRHPFFLHLKGSDTILHLFMRTSSDLNGHLNHTNPHTIILHDYHLLKWLLISIFLTLLSGGCLLTVTALYHNNQRNYIGTELTITTHDCGISSPTLSFSQAVHQKTVILRKSYLSAYLSNHSPISEGTL